ncbi:hypothetical protein OIU85_014106 [Salix viminalis]|uniref:Uncharacterized protein n=1 Tax=Salix viminalis TaxID=40686 RepID=A0A9Q0NN37_SALVM|nr:hypothetical protein OIU85_014106 [Salix viminalis]
MAISRVGKTAGSDLITMNGQRKKQLLNQRHGPMEAIDRENYGSPFHQARSHRFCMRSFADSKGQSSGKEPGHQARSQALTLSFLLLGCTSRGRGGHGNDDQWGIAGRKCSKF